jgi:hypothetical protein
MAYVYNPSTQEDLKIWDNIVSSSLGAHTKTCLKNKQAKSNREVQNWTSELQSNDLAGSCVPKAPQMILVCNQSIFLLICKIKDSPVKLDHI